MIPKIIHYCWFGNKPLTDDTKKYIDTWRKYCPEYEIIEWNESNFDIACNDYVREAYRAKKWAFVSDYARLKVLYDYGGIYMDTDVEVCKNLDELLQYNLCFGFQDDKKIQTAVIFSSKNNKVLKTFLDSYNQRKFSVVTNVDMITAFLKSYYNSDFRESKYQFDDGTAILDFEKLCAKSYINGRIYKSGDTYTIHHFEGSWLGYKEKMSGYLQKKLAYFLGLERYLMFKRVFRSER